MQRRFLVIALLLATIVQGTALAYAATLGESIGDATTHACGGQPLADGNDCHNCCSHHAMPSCASQCPVPTSAALLMTLPASQRTALHFVIVPDPGIGAFAEHNPPHPLRPPIV